MKSIRMYVSIILALLSIGLAGYQLSQDVASHHWSDPSTKMVTNWDGKIQSLRDFLPADVTMVGYLETAMVSGQPHFFDEFDGEEFFLMQYSLAPVTLDIGIDQPWIVGNFDNKTEFLPWLDKNLGNYEIQNFGYSLYLIHRLDK